jgi:hypothetical protein
MAWTQVANIKGPAGAAGPPGSPGVGFTWRSAWSGATSYSVNDAVSYQGSSYICIVANSAQVPTNTAYWSLMAQQGATGPAGPSAASADANNKATLGSDSLILVQGTAAGVAATTHTQTVSGDDPQLTNARAPTAHQASHVTGADQIPNASASARGFLSQLSGNTTDFVDGTNACQNLVTAIQPTIWSARLRSFNAAANPGMEVDQVQCGTSFTLTASTKIDRWFAVKTGTMVATGQQVDAGAGGIVVPTTSFAITSKFFRITLTTPQASLAAGDYLLFQQIVEAPVYRELMSDVHSVQVLVRTSVSGIRFGMSIRGPQSSPTSTLTKLSPALTANQWTLVQFPNLPNFPSGWPYTPGNAAYYLAVTLAGGSTWTSPANDTWQAAQYFAAQGQSNFAASPVNSTFDLAFCQHQPGAVSETLIDKPFSQNYDECLRYYQKSFDYEVSPTGGASNLGLLPLYQASTTALNGPVRFHKPMAKNPTMTAYNHATGAANSIRMAGTDYTVSSFSLVGKAGCQGVNTSTLPAVVAGNTGFLQYTADTGW